MSDQRAGTAGWPATRAGWVRRPRDVSGGWLRAAVFGAVDGLVTNATVIGGLSGGGGSARATLLTGAATLVAGAFALAAIRYIAVSSQHERAGAEVYLERPTLSRVPAAERAELAGFFRDYGADRETAARMAAAAARDLDTARPARGRGGTGGQPRARPAPLTAAVASFFSFAAGALVPLLPYLAGAGGLALMLVLSAAALVTGGMAAGRLSGRPVLPAGLRQLAFGTLAIAVTYLIGALIGGQGV